MTSTYERCTSYLSEQGSCVGSVSERGRIINIYFRMFNFNEADLAVTDMKFPCKVLSEEQLKTVLCRGRC